MRQYHAFSHINMQITQKPKANWQLAAGMKPGLSSHPHYTAVHLHVGVSSDQSQKAQWAAFGELMDVDPTHRWPHATINHWLHGWY
jgi:hypothetical protein